METYRKERRRGVRERESSKDSRASCHVNSFLFLNGTLFTPFTFLSLFCCQSFSKREKFGFITSSPSLSPSPSLSSSLSIFFIFFFFFFFFFFTLSQTIIDIERYFSFKFSRTLSLFFFFIFFFITSSFSSSLRGHFVHIVNIFSIVDPWIYFSLSLSLSLSYSLSLFIHLFLFLLLLYVTSSSGGERRERESVVCRWRETGRYHFISFLNISGTVSCRRVTIKSAISGQTSFMLSLSLYRRRERERSRYRRSRRRRERGRELL